MPLGENNTRTFHRTLYSGAGMLQTVTVLKRGNDQKQGTVTTFKLFECRWSKITKEGETIQADMVAEHKRVLHIPRIEMDRVGIGYFNVLDRFIDRNGRYWQPEAMEAGEIEIKLLENHWCVPCLRVDPPKDPNQGYGPLVTTSPCE